MNAVMIIKIIRWVMIVGISVSFFITLLLFFKRAFGEDTQQELKKEISKKLLDNGKGAQMRLTMSKYGVMFHMENYNMSPTYYLGFRAVIGLAIFAVLVIFDVKSPLIILAIPAGYYGVPILFKIINSSDNKEMLIDIFNTYANINIQLKVGQYIANALEYSYHTAKNKRYKEAMGELVLNMADKTVTVEESIQIFQNRFASNEIDKLCMMLRTLMRYGNNEEFTQDLLDEIKEIIQADAMQAQSDIETKASGVSFGFFGIVILLVVISVMMNFESGGFFF